MQVQQFRGSIYLVTSGGGVTSIDTARRFPVRLLKSGPAGGAIFASQIAASLGESKVLSFDMGGTTAKICLIEKYQPETSRVFEVDRAARFLKGSGLPVRIPVIEMVEIGAGGGSIARVDAMKRVTVGPESASSEPGPACYGRGGEHPTVTDADVALGKIDPDGFAGGTIKLSPELSRQALLRDIGEPLGLSAETAAYAVQEIVCENMASAARVHAVERGAVVGAAYADCLRRRGASACRARRREDRRFARDRAVQRRCRLGGRISCSSHRLRARAQPSCSTRRIR